MPGFTPQVDFIGLKFALGIVLVQIYSGDSNMQPRSQTLELGQSW